MLCEIITAANGDYNYLIGFRKLINKVAVDWCQLNSRIESMKTSILGGNYGKTDRNLFDIAKNSHHIAALKVTTMRTTIAIK